MKIFKDKFMEWLDKEIDVSPSNKFLTPVVSAARLATLLEVKEKLNSIIQEEFEKMKNNDNSRLHSDR